MRSQTHVWALVLAGGDGVRLASLATDNQGRSVLVNLATQCARLGAP